MTRLCISLAAGCVLLLVATSTVVAADRWWLGESFENLPLTHSTRYLYIYGDCNPEPDAGCPAPLEIQNRRTCERNPVSIDVPPHRVYRVRGGGIAAAYGGGGIDVLTGHSTVTVFSGRARAQRGSRRCGGALKRRRPSGWSGRG